MIKNLSKIDWTTVTIIAPECNLDCVYCNIAKAKKTLDCGNKNLLHLNTIQALEDGSYLNNIKTIFNRFQQNPKKVEGFEIWGQEPTLLLSNLTPHWKEWIEFLPNLSKIAFSTNGVACTEDFANFIIEVDNCATKDILMDLQYSYDGSFGQKEARKDKLEENNNIINNFIKLLTILNTHKFKKVKVQFNLHAVLSIELLEYLNNFENIRLFFEEHNKNIILIKDNMINKNVTLRSADIICQNCGKFTTDYGFDLLTFVNSVNRLKERKDYEYYKIWGENHNIAQGLFGVMTDDIVRLVVESPYNNLNDYLDNLVLNKNRHGEPCMCGSMTGCIRVTYDGYILDCHGSVYDNNIDESKLEETIFDQSRYQWTKHHRNVNALTDSDEVIDEAIDFYNKTHSPSITFFMWHNLVNQIYLLALAGQANKDYLYDFDKLKRHAFILARNNQCYHGLKLMNGSIFGRGNEEIRQICNGIMDIIDDNISQIIHQQKGNR